MENGASAIEGESANQDARFVLPQAAETKTIVTMNCRELMHFFKERCCARAQWEIRRLAEEMLKICEQKLSAVFNNSGAKGRSVRRIETCGSKRKHLIY